jgi:hypothetical protein
MLRAMETKQEFIPAEDYEEAIASDGGPLVSEYEDTEEYSDAAESCRELSGLATSGNGVSRISVPRELKRQRVVSAFQDAFELIGGVPRLAHWADTHPTDFYKLYARLLPAEASKRVTHDGGFVIKHVLPRGPLDE